MRQRVIAVGLSVLSSAWILTAPSLHAQAPAWPTGTSVAKAKELAALMQSKKLESFAAKVPEQPARYTAVLLTPGVQMTVVTSTYERFSDIDYRIYYKQFNDAFMDLRTGVMAKDKFIVEDFGCDGLAAAPAKNAAADIVTGGTAPRTFDADIADPKKRNQKPPKISADEYLKLFTANDEHYAKLLDVLLTELKKI